MQVDIDRHILSEIIAARKRKKECINKQEHIRFKMKTELNRISVEIHELEGREDALLLHMVSSINNIDTGKGQETNMGKEIANEIKGDG